MEFLHLTFCYVALILLIVACLVLAFKKRKW